MDKLKMQSENLVDENIEFIGKKFPNCIFEAKNDKGEIVKAVDFDMLKQELSKVVVESNDERYMLNWAGKKQSILTANSPINATLRPYKEESVGKDGTNGGFDSENLYIEGDNLDVLKLLRETYLNKIKMIYIDPPYNTGNDFVYNDDFSSSSDEYLQNSKSYDDEGNRMVQNLESNGRFHSDWLSMIYPRLKLARDLLTDDGVIFISIDDNEQANLKKICDEIFGELNFIAQFVWNRKNGRQNDSKFVSVNTEYILCYSKSINECIFNLLPRTEELNASYKNPDNDPRGPWTTTKLDAKSGSRDFTQEYIFPNGVKWKPSVGRFFAYSTDTLKQLYEDNRIWFGENGQNVPRVKKFLSEVKQGLVSNTLLLNTEVGTSQKAKEDYKKVMINVEFDNPKPIDLLKYLLILGSKCNDSYILDFFSGSATTAHAVMQLNAEDGGNRKFIMVQLPEKCDEKSEAYKAGYKNICEIGKERIRRVGKKIIEEKILQIQNEQIIKINEKTFTLEGKIQLPDVGFRVLKLDSSNMKDVYYNPADIKQDLLSQFESNIKEDRSSEDLLFQVMLDMGVMLSSEIRTLDIKGKKVFNVNDGNLVCCFDENLTDEVVTEIAKMQPLYAVFRDSSMSSDSVAVNFDQIFEAYSPNTTRKVL